MIQTSAGSRFPNTDDQKIADAHNDSEGRKKAMSWLTVTIILINVGFASLLAVGIYQFGSVASALAYLRGDGLIPDAYAKDFGTVSNEVQHSVEFLLSNYSKQPIKLLGTNSSCTCLTTDDLPVIVPPNGNTTLRVTVRAKSGPGSYFERLSVITDRGGPYLLLSVRGEFR